jgi:hypothetical protein
VPRAAAFETRIAACVAACLLPDVDTPVVQTMGVQELIESGQPIQENQLTTKQRYSIEEGMPRFGFPNGIADLPASGQQMKHANLWGLQNQITCPALNISTTGEGDGVIDSAQRFFDALPNPLTWFVLTTEDEGAELHTVRAHSSLLDQIEFGWLDEVLTK